MTPYEALTAQDKEYITEYIETWGGINSPIKLKAPLDYILKEWNKSKQTLFNIFGEKLMLEKEIVVEDGANKKAREISEYLYSTNPGINFIISLRKLFELGNYFEDTYATRNAIYNLIQPNQLYTNKVVKGFSYRNKDGKVVKVPEGAKVMRVLQKMAKEFDLPDFDIFRNHISHITEVRKSKIKFTLSIHPLDYMTMSDNVNGWESCMNWTQGPGSYRAGTIEMMNSPLVVVAYITTKPYYPANTSIEWTSKSWRELIIVHPNTICSVKSYPYYNIAFDKALVNWLADLVEEKTEWRYNRKIPQESLENSSYIEAWQDKEDEENRFILDFATNAMYNDFGNTENYAIFSVNPPDNKYNMFTINYSGLMTCMCCGGSDYWGDDTETVVCEECDPPEYCYCCGERINANNAIEVDGELVCEDCYHDLPRCMCCEDAHFEDNFIPVFIGHIDNQTINVDYDEHYICSDCLTNEEGLSTFLGDSNIKAEMVKLNDGPYYGLTALLIEEDDLDVEAKRTIANDPYSIMISNYPYAIRRYPERFYGGNTSIAI